MFPGSLFYFFYVFSYIAFFAVNQEDNSSPVTWGSG